jgi:hypothetical protein
MIIKYLRLCTLLLILLFPAIESNAQDNFERAKIISVDRIWDRGGHNAFTDLVNFNNTFYCVFREGIGHTPKIGDHAMINGTIRMLASKDGENWVSVAHIFEKDVDLRDPKLTITPDNRLMILMGGSVYNGKHFKSSRGRVCFYYPENGALSKIQEINIDKKIRTGGDWLWNITWHNGTAYGVVYQGRKNALNKYSAHLVKSTDGINYEYVSSLEIETSPTEADVKFLDDGRMVIIIRGKKGEIGVSTAPYKKWEWNTLPVPLGGPELIVLKNGKLICATREYIENDARRTILAEVTLDGGFKRLVTLPSSGDTSYPGMVIKDGILYVTYYSSHEGQTTIYTANREKKIGKTSIYLAKIWVDELKLFKVKGDF